MSSGILRCNIGLLLCGLILMLIVISYMMKSKSIRAYINENFKKFFILVFLLALLGRYFAVFLSYNIEKYINDFNLFVGWADLMIDTGIKGFASEYSAFYLYIIYGMRWLQRLLNLDNYYLITCLWMRTPAILCDLGIGYFIYKIAVKRIPKADSLLLCSMILFMPAFVINSSMWGQIDGILCLTIAVSFYLLDNNKRFLSTLIYFLSCMIKIQGIFFAPIFGMIYILPYLKKKKKFNINNIFKDFILPIAICILTLTILTFPFKSNQDQFWIFDYFKHITTHHPQNTLGAFNLFGLHGSNEVDYLNSFLFMNYKIWGYIFIFIICLACVYFVMRSKKHSIYLLGAFCISGVFTLGVSMHERYILPFIPLMLMAYIYDTDKRYIYFAVAYSLLAWFNQAMILFRLFYQNDNAFRIGSAISVAIFAGMTIFTNIKTNKDKKLIR